MTKELVLSRQTASSISRIRHGTHRCTGESSTSRLNVFAGTFVFKMFFNDASLCGGSRRWTIMMKTR